jgi:hypothetical protein
MKTRNALSVVGLVLSLCSMSRAQLATQLVEPSHEKTVAAASRPHELLGDTLSVSARFLTIENKIEIPVLAGLYAFDGFTTQRARTLEGGHFVEMNPLVRSLVQTRKGQVIAGVLGMSTTVGTAYVLHRFHHDRAARWFMRANVSGETLNVLALAVTTYGPSRRIW